MYEVKYVPGRIPSRRGPEISKRDRERNEKPKWVKCLSMLVRVLKFVFRYGYIPLILYLGYTKGPDPGCPKFTPLALVGLDFLDPPDSIEDLVDRRA